MGRQRTASEEQIAELLRTARTALGLGLSFLSRLDDTTQHLEVVESAIPFVFRDGSSQPRETSLCQAILEGKLPPVIPDVASLPEAKRLPAARFPRIRSYVSVPVVLSDGSLYGTFCAAGFSADRGLSKRDRALMEVLAKAAATIIEPEVRQRARTKLIRGRIDPLIEHGGPAVLLQPIVDLQTGVRVGAEALSRFPAEWDSPPDVCFAQAHDVGEGITLELLAIARAATALAQVGGYVAINASPITLLDPRCTRLLRGLPLRRILLELSEHDPVQDYPELAAVLDPLRADGMRLAIDDVGSGYSSLRHIVLTAPDVIKLDRSIIAGVGSDPVIHSLVRSLLDFGRGCGARVVAEGVETVQDAGALAVLGVDLGQGWLFGRPVPAADLPDAAPVTWPVAAVPEPAQTQSPLAPTPR
jgi:EAL domain-containing protein (putative c-di-GMP-specific phosphodiesterase class I)